MTTSTGTEAYAPFALVTDPAELGLVRTVVHSSLGTAVAHHRPTATSTRATIFIHGAAGSWTTWTPLLQEAAAHGIPIPNPILLDLPGWGSGTLTASTEEISLEAVCTTVKDCAEELGFIQWDVVGHSMGGFIALQMAATNPQCVLSVGVVSGTGSSIIGSVDHPARNFRILPAFTLLWRAMVILAPLGSLAQLLVRGIRALGGMRLLVRPLFRYPARVHRSVVDSLGSELRPRSFALGAQLVKGYDPLVWWSRIECPVRALNGDADVFSRASDLGQLARIVPGSVALTIAGCGHFAAIERPAAVLRALGFDDSPAR